MQLKPSSILRLTALVIAAAAPNASFASSETFLNGKSIYGQPAAASNAVRTIDLSQTARVSVAYGETVVFRGNTGQQFAWTFNGLDRRAVNLAKIAPAGFGSLAAVAHVGRDPSNRH